MKISICKATLSAKIGNKLETFKNVEVELGVNWNDSYITFELNKKDLNRFNSLGLNSSYTVKNAIIEFDDYSDYQRSSKWLTIKPIDIDTKISFQLKYN